MIRFLKKYDEHSYGDDKGTVLVNFLETFLIDGFNSLII